MSASRFVHLHVHSEFSLLSAPIPLTSIPKRAKELGMGSVALTDLDNLSGAMTFYKKSLERGVKPVLGCEVHLAPASRLERGGGLRASGSPLVLLCRNIEGWHNLVKIVSDASLKGFYYRPRTDLEVLREHAQGLICLTGSRFASLPSMVGAGQEENARAFLASLQSIFGEENVVVELVNQGSKAQAETCRALTELARKAGAPYVATNDVWMLGADDLETLRVLWGLRDGKNLEDVAVPEGPLVHFTSAEEMAARFTPEALEASVAIADRCNVEIDFKQRHMPVFKPDEGGSDKAFLRKLTGEGLRERYPKITDELQQRVDYELGVIEKLGFPSYFLIVWDFIRQARTMGIPVGPGRGSCVGSVVSYCLGITDLDPLSYDLIFERFLTADRVSDPDIDIDFCRDGRDRVIEYVRQKYGAESVAQIATFGTLGAKAVIRDVGRVLAIPLDEVNTLAKAIPETLGMNLETARKENPDIEKMLRSNGAYQHLWHLATKLEGLVRHMSVHAAGVVIADAPLNTYVPLSRSHDVTVTQFDKDIIEECGILKMDFLGLKTLTVIARTVDSLSRSGVKVDIEKVPLDNAAAYALMQRGETRFTFQFESDGMRDLMVKMKPDRFTDLIALVALFRPGPLKHGMEKLYVERKHGLKPVEIPHPLLEPILRDSFGILIYQEQAMSIAHKLAGFSLSEADLLRKAMAKKKQELMESFRGKFAAGCKKGGIPEKVAHEVFALIEAFGEYGFNKSHSAAYALISYRTCWLKANHGPHYMAAVMSCDAGDSDKISEAMSECQRLGIKVKPPDVNISGSDFAVDADGGVRFGLTAVKGVGGKAVESILAERSKGGPFRSLLDFCSRVELRLVNKSVLEALVKSGSLDSFGSHRAALMAALEDMTRISSRVQKDKQAGQNLLFGEAEGDTAEDLIPSVPPWSEAHQLKFEKETTGFYLSQHPLTRHVETLRAHSGTNLEELRARESGAQVVAGGIVTNLRALVTKKGKNPGQKMCAFTLEDLHASLEGVLFPEAHAKYGHLLTPDAIVFLKGRLDRSREAPQLMVDEVITLESVASKLPRQVVIRLGTAGLDEDYLARLAGIFRNHRGDAPVLIEFVQGAKARTLEVGPEFRVAPGEALERSLEDLLGPGRVHYTPLVKKALVG
ncbi:MAG: DNA polymerase III subunit alpha [Planctomycetota bacterium]